MQFQQGMDLLPPTNDDAAAAAPDVGVLRAEIARLRQSLAAQVAAAREREEVLRAVVDGAPGAVVLLDEVGNLVFTNAGARDLFFEGVEPEGRNFLEMLASLPEPLRKALLSDVDRIFSFASDGQSETFHLAKRQLTLHGQPHNLLIVRHMTLEVSRQENAVLRKAIRVIHHELANSLTPAVSLLQSVRRRLTEIASAPQLQQMLAVVEDRVSHLNAFLGGFAALGRLPRPRACDVPWESFLTSLRQLLPDVCVMPAPAGSGWFDPAQIQQILLNLVKNAREAGSPAGDIVLEVVAAVEGGHRVSVLDRGEGMTDKVLENALVPSFTTKADGSGMGLALCREIVDGHEGHLGLARRAGGGMAVVFWLPPREPVPASARLSRARLTVSRVVLGSTSGPSTG